MINWDAIGSVGEVIGALAVVITILYLAAQVRLANGRAAADLQSKISDNSSEVCDLVLNNEHLVDLLLKLTGRDLQLSEREAILAEYFSERVMNMYWTTQIAYDSSQITGEVYESMVEDCSRYMKSYPGLVKYCREVLGNYGVAQNYRIFDAVFDRNPGA